MNLLATFGRFLKRNEKTGVSRFTARTSNGVNVIVNGICLPYPKYTPVQIEYSSSDGNIYEMSSIKAYGYNDIVTSQFLSNGYYTGIKMTTADKMIKVIGTSDIFSYISTLSDTTPVISRIPVNVIESFVKKTRWITRYEELIAYISHN